MEDTVARDNFYAQYLERFRAVGIGILLFAPFTSVVTNPISLFQSLLNTVRGLGNGWSDYSGFSSSSAFLKLFYHTQARELMDRGKRGVSPYLGLGNLDMRRFWYQSTAAVALQRSWGGVVVVCLGMAVWALSHLTWLDWLAGGKVFATVAILAGVFSTNFYGNLFSRQNYNVLAWAFFPAALLALLSGQPWYLVLAVSVVAWLSITVFLFLSGVVFVASIAGARWDLLLCLMPGALYYVFILKTTLFTGDIGRGMAILQGLLGFLGGKKNVGLMRPPRMIYAAAFSAFWAAFPIGVWLWHPGYRDWSPAALAAIAALPVLWFFVNQSRLFRLADAHNLLFYFLTVTVAITLTSQSWCLLALFWLLNSNPLIAFQLYQFDTPTEQALLAPSVVAPISVRPYREAVAELLSPVPTGEKLLLAFDDPKGSYNALFDGYSDLYQLFLDVAVTLELHAFPDWYSVEAINEGPLPPLWGREPAALAANVEAWNVRYALVYRKESQRELTDTDLSNHHLEAIARFDWRKFRRELAGSPLFTAGWIEWILVRRL